MKTTAPPLRLFGSLCVMFVLSCSLSTPTRSDELPRVPASPEIETLTDGYRFTEGPALAPDGSIYFSDIPNQSIHRFDPETDETTLVTNESGGANGLMFTADGQLAACEGGNRRMSVSSVEPGETPGEFAPRLLAITPGEYNGPNDVALLASGKAAFFTDPNYAKRDNPSGIEGVYRVGLEVMTRSLPGQYTVARVIDDLQRPNGIGLSPDNRTLYVADNRAKTLHAYPLDEHGERDGVGGLFHDLTDLGGPDGMTIDAQGRLYVAVYDQGVLVLSPDGQERLGFIETGKQTTNCVFGADGRTLYVTADHALKRVMLNP